MDTFKKMLFLKLGITQLINKELINWLDLKNFLGFDPYANVFRLEDGNTPNNISDESGIAEWITLLTQSVLHRMGKRDGLNFVEPLDTDKLVDCAFLNVLSGEFLVNQGSASLVYGTNTSTLIQTSFRFFTGTNGSVKIRGVNKETINNTGFVGLPVNNGDPVYANTSDIDLAIELKVISFALETVGELEIFTGVQFVNNNVFSMSIIGEYNSSTDRYYWNYLTGSETNNEIPLSLTKTDPVIWNMRLGSNTTQPVISSTLLSDTKFVDVSSAKLFGNSSNGGRPSVIEKIGVSDTRSEWNYHNVLDKLYLKSISGNRYINEIAEQSDWNPGNTNLSARARGTSLSTAYEILFEQETVSAEHKKEIK